jgi:hypothetical protein
MMEAKKIVELVAALQIEQQSEDLERRRLFELKLLAVMG